nr:hypothetical protein [Tanacetum cinerariifolium]
MCQNLQVQVEKLKSVNESFNLSIEELYKARAFAEATLREKDAIIFAQCEKIRLLEEQSESFYEVHSEFESETVLDTQNNPEKDLILNLQTQVKESELLEKVEQIKSQVSKLEEKLQISDQEIKQQIILFEEDKRILETKFKFLKHDHSLEKMFEMIEQEYESNVSKISITSSTFETKNFKLVKEMGNKVKRFDDDKKVFENNISKLEKDLAQRFKDFDDVKIELSG